MTWRLIHSQKTEDDFKRLCERARSEGRLTRILETMKRLAQRPKADPLNAGDPYNRLKHLGLRLYVIVDRPLVVHYAVDEQRHWVYLRRIDLLS